jgi:hypothetical protein
LPTLFKMQAISMPFKCPYVASVHLTFQWYTTYKLLYYYNQRFTGCHPSPQLFTEHSVHSSAITSKFPYMEIRRMLDRKILTFFAFLG